MSVLVLDTNVVSFLMKGHRRAEPFRPHLAGKTLAISFMVLAEMYEGADRANWGVKKLARLDAVLRHYVVIPSSPEICRQWGKVRAVR
ncbi:MAG TPA: PIN domain-containing protein [Phycisphaerae bacterium]